MNLLATLIGTGAALCTISSFVPQILKIVRERDASSVSLRMYALTVAAFVLWIAYGAMSGAWPVVAANAVSLVLAAIALWMKWRFREGPKTPV